MINRLQKCNAYVLTDSDCEFIKCFHAKIDEETRVYYLPQSKQYKHTLVSLISYNSLVAVFDCDTDYLFLLPQWNYSLTTQSHIRKFAKDYLNLNVCKHDLINNCVAGCETIICTGYEAWVSGRPDVLNQKTD